MNRIVLDHSLTKQLQDVEQPSELFDSAGHKLGFFTPREYEGYECPLTDAELDRIEQQGGGRPLEEILRDLEKRA